MKLTTWIKIADIIARVATEIIRALRLVDKDNNRKPVGG